MNECWGPYCPVPQRSELFPRYVHVVYPTARGTLLWNDTVRELDDHQLDAISEAYSDILMRSFTFSGLP